jgi:hypothetical protein
VTQPQPVPPTTVQPLPESRLDQLCAELASVEPEYDRVKARYDELRNAIKTEMAAQAKAGQELMYLQSAYLPPMQYKCYAEWRVDMKALKSGDPEIYVKHAVRKYVWKLEKVK